jgi:cellular nucleic acid-binding protein
MVYIYALKLKHNKYYIGKTSNPDFRIESHFNSKGSEWTKIHNPVKLLELIDGDDYDEYKYTKIYMDKYGIDNVRGGSYTSIILDNETKNQLVKNSNSTNNRCFKCGKCGHFANNCKDKGKGNSKEHDSEDNSDDDSDDDDSDDDDDSEDDDDSDDDSNSEENAVWCCEYCDKEFEDEGKCEYHERYCKKKGKQKSGNSCFKCGKYGHFANNCWSNKSSSKSTYKSSSSTKKCDICGKYGHYEVNCDKF